jgi:rhamnogalacturonyl hydrolase YesR
MFNNHQEEWKELVTDVDPDHDVTSKTAAFDLALRGGFKLGILYREQRSTLNEKYKALVEASKESDVNAMLEAFNARKGAAIGKPVL